MLHDLAGFSILNNLHRESMLFFIQRCYHVLVMIVCLISFVPVQAAEASSDLGKEILIGVSSTVPPYIDPATGAGIEIQLIQEAFSIVGYRPRFKFLTRNGSENNYKAEKIDVILINRSANNKLNGYLSEDLIAYHNYAISLKRKKYKLKNIDDLSYYRVVGFYNATRYLGAEYSKAVSRSPLYREVETQADQVHALYREMVDIVIADARVFEYFQNEIKDSVGVFHEVVKHELFSDSPRHLFFQSRVDRDLFDLGLRTLKAKGRYESILTSLTEQ